MGPPLQHVCGIAIGACEARAVVIRRDSAAQGGIAQPSLVSSESGARGTPCAVALGGKGECVVGDAALSQAAKNPKATVPRALSALPRSGDTEDALRARLVAAGAGKVTVDGDTIQLTKTLYDEDGDETEVTSSLSGADVVSKIFAELRDRVADFLGADSKETICCVLSAPPDILADDVAKAALLAAAATAGLRVLQVVDEAACVASFAAQDDQHAESVVVLDVGGTKATATVFSRHATGLLTRSKTQTDPSLSGDAFTSALYAFAATFLKRRQKIDVESGGARAKLKLEAACVRAAKLLGSGLAQADVEADALVDGQDARARVTRSRFEDLTSDVASKAAELVKAVAGDGTTLLIFAGQAAKSAPLRKAAEEALSSVTVADFGEASELACVGAARQAALLAFGAEPAFDLPAEKKGKGLAKAFGSSRADFCLAQNALPSLDADVTVAAGRLAAFPKDATAAQTALAPLVKGAVAVAAACAPLPLGTDTLLKVAGAGPALVVAVFAGGALVTAVDASALGAATEVLAVLSIAADAALTVAVEAGGTRLPEVLVPSA